MILRILLILLPVLASPFSSFNKSHYYVVFAKGTMAEIKEEISGELAMDFPGRQAYEGALLMKRAGLRSLPVDKMHDFKKGHAQLESAIASDTSNTEYRFLRLCIQEQAPSFLHYNEDLDRDNLYIHRHFNELSGEVRIAVLDYSRHSHVLRNL
jgi:hypothetical protein